MISQTCNFYLERVGFEAKVNYRQSLKFGKNIIGRSDAKGIDIPINSGLCSRHHCLITVTDDSVELEDLKSSNGTTFNGALIHGKVTLKERDIIGVVGGANPLQLLVGNCNFMVYRLCKYTSDNIPTFEIEDDDPIILSDDEDNVVRLESDDECIDIKEEHDKDIQLSWEFNMEIKQELLDLEEYEALNINLKKELFVGEQSDENFNQFNEYHNETTNGLHETNENSFSETETIVDSGSLVSLDDNPVHDEDDNSNETVCFPTYHERSNDLTNHLTDNYDNAVPLSDHTNLDRNNSGSKDVDRKLNETVSKITDNERNGKRGPELIHAKPLQKRRKTKIYESSRTKKGKVKTANKEDIKEKLKVVASTSAKSKSPDKQKPATQTTPKVKFTPHNRGFFLIDEKQTPVLPKEVLPKHRANDKTNNKTSPEKIQPSVEYTELSNVPTPTELDLRILKEMSSLQTVPPDSILPSNSERASSSNIVGSIRSSNQSVNDIQPMEIVPSIGDNSGTCNSFEYEEDEEDDMDVENVPDCQDDVEQIDEGEKENENDDSDVDDVDDFMYDMIMKLPPETGNVKIIEEKPKPDNVRSILKSFQSKQTNSVVQKRKVTFKETGFQNDPRHQIISDITSYDHQQFETVDAFCQSINTNVRSFADSYENYDEYRDTLVALVKVELWKEIEMEYRKSDVTEFTTVTTNYSNIEKRGAGRRMVFHCQADSLYKSQSIQDGHLVYAKCKHNDTETEFLALITSIAYSNKIADQKLAYFTMETSALTEILDIQLLRIRPITVIMNTLNAFNAIHNLNNSPLRNLVINPLPELIVSQHTTEKSIYKGFDPLDDTQLKILNQIFMRCINLAVPNISLLDGGAGTGKTCMIANLALQLVYGDELRRPLRILICSQSHGNINDITRKLMNIRDSTTSGRTKIQLVRYGFLQHMDDVVQRVSVQILKGNEKYSPQFTSYDELVNQKTTLSLKITALSLDKGIDHSAELKLLQKQLFKVDTILSRFEGLERKNLRDTTTFILNSCDIICTTLGSIPKLQNFVNKVDVCIIDEATQVPEPLTLLPFQLGMPSLVLVGDSQLLPRNAYSPVVKELNFGNSLFSRLQKQFLGKYQSPLFEMSFQYRMHKEILEWPNYQFYKNCLVPHETVKNDSFPIAPYKMISYPHIAGMKESDHIMLVIKVLLGHVDWNTFSMGVICTNFKQNSIMMNKLRNYPYISTNIAKSYISEKDVVIIWISEEHGIGSLSGQQILNHAVTRARKSLLILGENLTNHRHHPAWRSLLENAIQRKCLKHFKEEFTAAKLCSTLIKSSLERRQNQCALCRNLMRNTAITNI